MAKVQVKKLAQYGIISDIEPYELPSNAWTAGSNISFEKGGVSRIQGMLPFMKPSEGEAMSIYTKDNLLYYTTNKGIFLFSGRDNMEMEIVIPPEPEEPGCDCEDGVCGEDCPCEGECGEGCECTCGEEKPDPEPDGETFTIDFKAVPASKWNITELSNVIVFSSDSQVPLYKPLNKLHVSPLPAWDKKWRSSNVKSYKNFLLALGISESGTEYPQRVRWSDIAFPNEPPKDWDATSTTNSAGFNDLSNTKGTIIDGLELNDKFYVYTEDDVHVIEYVGGNDIFRFRKLLENVGILAKGCVCKVDGGHFVVTRNDVGVHNGNSFKSVIEGMIKEQLFEEIRNSHDYNDVQVISYPAKSEVWVTYKTAGNRYYNKAAIFNTASGVWSFRELPNMTAIHYGVAPRDAEGFIDDQDKLVDEDDRIIDDVGKDFVRAGLFMNTEKGVWVAVDEGFGTPHRKNMACSVERHYLDFDDLGMEPDSLKQIQAVYPQVTGGGQMNVYIGTSNSPFEYPRWSPPVRINLRYDKKADFRVTGRYISIRFETMDSQEWKLLGYALDVFPAGGR